jgi:alpha-D-xyloside xylohydrolase
MFGSRYLIVPVLEPGQRNIKVYLPAGAFWTLWSKVNVPQEGIPKVHKGGSEVEVDCPIETLPVFYRVGT